MKLMFDNLTVREMFFSIMDVEDILGMYRTGIKTKNALLAVPAQNELIRRSRRDEVLKVLDEACREGGVFEPGSSFTQAMSESMMLVPDRTNIFKRLARCLLRAPYGQASLDDVLSVIEKRFEENDANELENTLRRLIREYGFTEKKFYEIVDEVYQETDNAGFIVGRGNSTDYPNHARKEGFPSEAKTAN